MNEVQSCKSTELSQKKGLPNDDLNNICSVSHSKRFCKNSNLISFCLIVSAVCISLARYLHDNTNESVTSENSVAENAVTDFKNKVNDNIDTENTDTQYTDTEFDEDEEWDYEDELLTDDCTIASTNEVVTLGKGDTLAKVLANLGINKSDIYSASVAVSRVFRLKKIKPGLQIFIETDKSDATILRRLMFRPDKRFKIIVEKNNGHFTSKKVTVPLKRIVKKISSSVIPRSTASSLQKCGVQKSIANDATKALSHVVGFSRLKTPVKLDLKYEQHCDELGNVVDSNLLAVVASVDGKLKKVYKFSIDGSMKYVDENGTVLGSKKGGSMFIKPLSYNKITSHFGYRYHPISGRGKMHTGVDFSAPLGTPIRATASGTVVMACRHRGYGKYIKINHSGGYSTAYAHLSRLLVQPGQLVSKGDTIGYIGSTGYATGIHLHYEVMRGNKFVNPLAFVPQPPQKLTGKDLVRFNLFKKTI